ncbi:hypothetical protein CI102_13968 [Trichoderma harzianum]|nr:hypothetical protein CI102_13968 [Trichoderma harzianum]
MSSISLSNRQWDSTWNGLPTEIRLLIFKALAQDGCRLSPLATVSREWQIELERHNFARIKLTPSRLADFNSMIRRNRAFVACIWFCLELDEYDCTWCWPGNAGAEFDEALAISDTDHCPITTSFHTLFSILSTWDLTANLILDISVYSPSDSKHFFKYLTFMPDTALDTLDGRRNIQHMVSKKPVHHDPRHGWVFGEGPFDSDQSELHWWDRLPSVPAVVTLLLRQQNRRRWKPKSLAHMFARFPRLQEVHYEPWREWNFKQGLTDRQYPYLFESIRRFNGNLKRLVVFENINQQYPMHMQRFPFGVEVSGCDIIRKPAPAVSRIVALTSLKLEHLAASFIVDANHFFNIEPSWEWPNLTSLVLTSKLLAPEKSPIEIGAMLQAAAAVATKMPKLKTMEIWNGRKGVAALFKYQVFHDIQQARITWRGTWEFIMEPSVIRAWEAFELLDEATIKSHGDAIGYLMLSGQVIRPISLQQIRIEQRALKGVMTRSE